MKNKSKLTIVRPTLEDKKVNQFISGAENKTNESDLPVTEETLPWDEVKVRSDLLKPFNLRLPEPYYLKLKYIAENGNKSQHAFLMNIVTPAIDEEINKLITKKNG